MTELPHFIILAAGHGSRFRRAISLDQHKALAPLWDHRGTLELMLEHLRSLEGKTPTITVATGYQAETVALRARQMVPNVNIVHNDTFASDTMLTTLAKTIATLSAQQQGFWVLFADTLYSRRALELMQMCEHTIPTVAVVRRLPGSHGEIGMTLKADGTVDRFLDPDATHQMAHAVYWPSTVYWRKQCSNLLEQSAADLSLSSQWQLLRQLDDVATLDLANFAAQDVDTPEQLHQLKPSVTPRVFNYFINNLNKDRRNLDARDARESDKYIKHCESVAAARHEARVLRMLNMQLPDIAPRLIGVEGLTITMRLASGIRLYDLLRQLTSSPAHERIRSILRERCMNRLSLLQQVLADNTFTKDPYPFDLQVSELLRVLCILLRLPKPPEHELNNLAPIWHSLCKVPFRDATPKNIIVVDPIVCPSLSSVQRQQAVAKLLQQPEDYWQQVPLQDIDFTSTRHLTTPQDDWLSLLGHAVNDVGKSNVLPDVCAPLCDLTLLVRYLRFGGRKLVYKLVNPSGFQVRFRYDEPCYYFVGICEHLSEDFQNRFPLLTTTLRAIRDKAEQFRGVKLSNSDFDPYLSTLRQAPRYWQESPLELS